MKTSKYIYRFLPTKTSGVVTAGKPVIGSQFYSREIQTVVQYKYRLVYLHNSNVLKKYLSDHLYKTKTVFGEHSLGEHSVILTF
jgi:hypothetical protein